MNPTSSSSPKQNQRPLLKWVTCSSLLREDKRDKSLCETKKREKETAFLRSSSSSSADAADSSPSSSSLSLCLVILSSSSSSVSSLASPPAGKRKQTKNFYSNPKHFYLFLYPSNQSKNREIPHSSSSLVLPRATLEKRETEVHARVQRKRYDTL